MQKASTSYDFATAKDHFSAKMAFTTGTTELNSLIEKGEAHIIDVRGAAAYAQGHIPGAINLPRDQWSTRKGLMKDKVNVLYCYSPTCHLSASAALEFLGEGYPVMEMEGGFQAWEQGGYPIHTDKKNTAIRCEC